MNPAQIQTAESLGEPQGIAQTDGGLRVSFGHALIVWLAEDGQILFRQACAPRAPRTPKGDI